MSPKFRLGGRIAVVTGALGKLGPVWMEALLEAGGRVLAIDLKKAGASPSFLALQRRFKPRLHFVRADITRRPQVLAARRACLRKLGAPHVLVNNAGIDTPPSGSPRGARFEDVPAEAVRKTFDVNFVGALQMLQVFGEDLIAGRGSVVNIGSLYASVSPDQRLYDHMPGAFLKPAAYGASKAALVNLTKYLATLWAPKGVRVNALSPGGVLGGQDPGFLEKYRARVPMGRMASAGDLAGPLVFLASDASSYVTGIDLVVDGGFTAW